MDKALELADKSFMELWDSYTSKKMECDDLQDKLRQQQAEIERLTTKNLEWLANWNEQQAEIEALKAIINEAFKSIPAMGEDGEFYHEHHGMDGEYLGYENIPANYVVQVIETILRKASEK